MGIPRLRHHLLPFCQAIALRKDGAADEDGLPWVHSVVIDGPSLVYNIYSRLLSWFSVSNPCIMDALPTCDEVSRGVVIYLLHLRIVGVEIQAIYFDGALPARKHETRIARLESQRRKLELFCASTRCGFPKRQTLNSHRTVGPQTVLRSRPLSSRYANVPIDPFIVATVFEDLKYRWSSRTIATTAGENLPLASLSLGAFPWADITTMVPGEADTYCAYTANATSSSVLTNDSDLVLHNLGQSASVIFLDSVELSGWSPVTPLQAEIRATALYPSLVARRFGISNLLPLAYELKTHPQTGLVELLQKAQNFIEGPNYSEFIGEYTSGHQYMERQGKKNPLHLLDTRVSELYWQYVMQDEYTEWDIPRVYLPVLQEDHTKRCAWVKGRTYRRIGYSVFNLSRPVSERHCYVTEFVRRGQRIAEDRVPLLGHESILTEMELLYARVERLQTNLNQANYSQWFWRIFALLDSYGSDAQFSQRDLQNLDQFLQFGYMGKQLEWADIHLTAEIQAILYSLRVLKQLLKLSNSDNGFSGASMELGVVLERLPSLYLAVDTCRHGRRSGDDSRIQILDALGTKEREERPRKTARQGSQPPPIPIPLTQGETASRGMSSQRTYFNLYEVLDEQ